MHVDAGDAADQARPNSRSAAWSEWQEKAFAGADWDAALDRHPLRTVRRIADLALRMGDITRLAEQLADEGLHGASGPLAAAEVANVVGLLWPEARWEGILDPNPGYLGPRRATLELIENCPCRACDRFAFAGPGTCEAFPHGIPNQLAIGERDHERAYPGDHGLRFAGDEWRTPAVGPLVEDIARDLGELAEAGLISRATALGDATSSRIDDRRPPVYFTGNPEAPVVLVHVAPRARDALAPSTRSADVGAYIRRHRAPGLVRFRNPTRRALSDRTLVEFVRPFILDRLPEPTPSPRIEQALALDAVLQLFVVPYRVTHLHLPRVPDQMLGHHLDRVLDVIAAVEREFVLFCNDAFREVLAPIVTMSTATTFRLDRGDRSGRGGRSRHHFVNALFDHRGVAVAAALISSIDTNGLSTAAYAKACRQLYRRIT